MMTISVTTSTRIWSVLTSASNQTTNRSSETTISITKIMMVTGRASEKRTTGPRAQKKVRSRESKRFTVDSESLSNK